MGFNSGFKGLKYMFMYFDCAVRRHVSAKSDVPTYPPTCQSACPSMMLIYLLTAIGLSPGASTHLHTNNTQNNTNNNRTTQITNVEECGPCPVFASFTLAFALQLRRKHGKTSVGVRKISVRLRKISVRLIKTSVSVKNISQCIASYWRVRLWPWKCSCFLFPC